MKESTFLSSESNSSVINITVWSTSTFFMSCVLWYLFHGEYVTLSSLSSGINIYISSHCILIEIRKGFLDLIA